MKKRITCGFLLASLVVIVFASCATEPSSQQSSRPRRPVPASELPPEFFATAECANIEIETDTSIHEAPKVPSRVTYIKADQAVIDQAVETIKAFFVQGDDPGLLFKDLVFCGPYLTRYLSKNKTFQSLEYIPTTIIVGNTRLEQRGFRTSRSVSAFAQYLRNSLCEEGGFVVRKASAAELDRYWSVIPWDIEEPVLVLQSPSHRIFLDFDLDKVSFADDFMNLR